MSLIIGFGVPEKSPSLTTQALELPDPATHGHGTRDSAVRTHTGRLASQLLEKTMHFPDHRVGLDPDQPGMDAWSKAKRPGT